MSPILRVRTLCTSFTPGVSESNWQICAYCSCETARSIRSCKASQEKDQPILLTIKPTMSAATGSRKG